MISLRRKEPEPPTDSYTMIQWGEVKPKRAKGKVPFDLELNVLSAVIIDGQENPNAYYYVVASVEHGQFEWTYPKRRTHRIVEWMEKLKMMVWEHKHYYVDVEVVRQGVLTDPGSSSGQTVVGKGRVLLPDVLGVTVTRPLQLLEPRKMAGVAHSDFGALLWVDIVVNQSLRWD